jgi:uncharacterized membrane protein (UPF0127 family)
MRPRVLGPTRVLFAFACLLMGCGCNRTEEPAAPSSVEMSSAPPAAGASSTAPARPPCLVPFGEPAPVAAKAGSCPADPTGNLQLPRGKVTFTDAPGTPQVEVELAREDAARERGLMYRTSMPDDHGMLFSWDDEQPRSFWMRNTCIPLDLLYVDKHGVISGILEQVPTLSDAPRGVACPVAHVLELNAGYARAHGITPGMKLKIEG